MTLIKVKGAVWNADENGLAPSLFDFGATGDGSTDDTQAFTDLEAEFTDQDIDLVGKTYVVTSLPEGNRYKNGFWKIGTLLYPANDTFIYETKKYTDTDYYDGWTQDKAHTYDGVIYTPYNQGTDHDTDDRAVFLKRSYDGGNSFTDAEIVFQSASTARQSFSAGEIDGRQVFCVAQFAVGGGTVPNDHRLFSRRLSERIVLGNNINTQSGSQIVTIEANNHGLQPGDVVNITSVGAPVGGIIISGDYTVTTRVDQNFYQFDGGTPATSTVTNGGDAEIVYKYSQGSFIETTFSGNSLGTAIEATPEFSALPVVLHSFASQGTTIWIGASGNGLALVTILDFFGDGGGPTLSATSFTNSSSRTEPTVKVDSSGNLYGFLRTQSGSVPPVFWTSTNGGASFTETIADQFGRTSPIPLIIFEDTTIYAFASERFEGNNVPAETDMYLLRADLADALANGWSAFERFVIGKLYFAGKVLTETTNVVGVASTLIFNDKLMLFYGSEEAYNGDLTRSPNSPNQYCTSIVVKPEIKRAGAVQRVYDRNQLVGSVVDDTLRGEAVTDLIRNQSEYIYNVLARSFDNPIRNQYGFGTKTPRGRLEVRTTSTEPRTSINAAVDDIVIQNGSDDAGISIVTPNSNIGQIAFSDPDAEQQGGVLYLHGVDEMRFDTAGTEAFRITGTNRLRSKSFGDAATPTYSWEDDPDNGVYRSGVDEVSIATAATQHFIVASNGRLQAGVDGTTALPVWTFMNETGMGATRAAADNLAFSTGGIERFRTNNTTTRPGQDNAYTLGSGSNRWSEVFAAIGTINTSDEREKDLIEEIPDEWLNAWANVNFKRFKYKHAIEKKGDGARWHIGFIAQQIKQAFADEGLDAHEIGLLCYDEWPDEYDEEGNLVVEAGNRYGLRYDQCLAMEAALVRRRLEQLEATIASQ